MLGVVGLSKVQRFLLGIFLLLLVDFLRVISSEVTEYIFGDEGFEKPFFTTYLKTTMFMLYLLGFLMWRPWRQQCRKSPLDVAMKAEDIDSGGETECYLTEAIYVPLKVEKTSGTESEDCTGEDSRSVRFSNLSEVRQLPDKFAEDALIARLSYTASLRAEQARFRSLSKLSVKEVAKLSFIFCILWFFANLAYQEALHDSEAGIVNVLSSTSGFFTLVLAAMYPACNADRFSLSKLVAVLISIAGVVLVSLSDMPLTADLDIPVGALWALLGAILYAFYLVVLRRKVDHEDKIDIPMFFGFVGLFNAVLIWPGFLILHYTRSEVFQWPSRQQWAYICVNGVVGMVVSELLWVWGCFLTSSLVATLGLSLTVPINMAADIVVKKVAHSWMFYVGCVPIFFSFFAVGFLSHYDGWDPVLLALKKLLHCVCRMKSASRIHVRDLDREQSESLIGVQTSDSPGHPT